jgi:hypothetical protein
MGREVMIALLLSVERLRGGGTAISLLAERPPQTTANHRAWLAMPSCFLEPRPIFSSTHQPTIVYFSPVLPHCRCRHSCLFLGFYNSHSHGRLDSGSYKPWPTHQPPLLARTISQPTAAGTIALEEAVEETEHRVKVKIPNTLRAATEMLAKAEAAVDAPEEGHQEGHQPLTNPAMRNPSPPPNNRSKQKERLWL